MLKALAREPDERFASAAELAQALEAHAPAATAETIGEWARSSLERGGGGGDALTLPNSLGDATVVSRADDPTTTLDTPLSAAEETSTAIMAPTVLRMPEAEDPFAGPATVVDRLPPSAGARGHWLLAAGLAGLLFMFAAALALALWLLRTASSPGPETDRAAAPAPEEAHPASTRPDTCPLRQTAAASMPPRVGRRESIALRRRLASESSSARAATRTSRPRPALPRWAGMFHAKSGRHAVGPAPRHTEPEPRAGVQAAVRGSARRTDGGPDS